MNASNLLHWSFDYNYGAQNPQFAQELISTLREYKPKVEEDFSPPGPDAEQLGCAQLFDRQNDPGETENLVRNAIYDEDVKICRDKLLTQEARLHRRHIVHPNPKRIISHWGERLRAYWEHGR